MTGKKFLPKSQTALVPRKGFGLTTPKSATVTFYTRDSDKLIDQARSQLYSIGMTLSRKNTPKEGQFRHIVFKDGDFWYAVALEFNIVEVSDDPRLAHFNLLQAVDGYIESMRKIKGARNFAALNQTPDPEYQKLWDRLVAGKSIKSPYLVNSYGISAMSHA